MIRNKLLLCFLGISACFVAGTVARLQGEGIVGGDKATANQFPYQISLQVYGQSICGGGIIHDQFVLTAAHCVVDKNGEFSIYPYNVVAGINNYLDTRNAVSSRVAKIYVPSDYKPQFGSNINDIAILKLKTPLGLARHHTIDKLQLPWNPRQTYADETVVISGFGWDWVTVKDDKETGGRTDADLRFAEADVLTTEQCQRNYRDRISEKQICARTKQRYISKPSGVCSGDSGGPLVHGGRTVVGVVSTSPIGCTEKYAAAVYTRVSSYLDFIQDAVADMKTSSIRTLELIPTASIFETSTTPQPTTPQPTTPQPTKRPVQSKPSSFWNSWFNSSWKIF